MGKDEYKIEKIIVENQRMRKQMKELEMEIERRKEAEEALKKVNEQLVEKVHRQNYDLGERIKELNCLYTISSLVEQPGTTLEDIIEGVLRCIPPAWQYPSITCASLVHGGKSHTTENYKETVWQMKAAIHVNGEERGKLIVGYLEERPEIDEGPFLEEERKLLNAICKRVGKIIEYKNLEMERESMIQRLQEALDQVKTLQGLIPICSHCKKIRDDQGYWNQLETFLLQHSEMTLTHGICPDCAKKYFSDFC